MKIAIGADHAGFEYKAKLSDYLESFGHIVIDVGTFNTESSDYPDFGAKVSQKVCGSEAEIGILICGTGIGMSIVANKFKGIRAAVCWNQETARLTREHNNANILCLGARFLTISECMEITGIFLKTSPKSEDKYLRRINKITNIEEGDNFCGK
ncbi:MAG: ribose 5-phosphate isomerase B [Actinobacteria bacterium]|nr:ribose 5-phosphate isomerase B [Actinomycetota bacterium]